MSAASDFSARSGSSKRTRTVEEVSDQLEELRGHMQSLAASVQSAATTKLKDTQAQLETTIQENPFASVAIAAGVGFLYALIRR